jgi:hypothetical protein
MFEVIECNDIFELINKEHNLKYYMRKEQVKELYEVLKPIFEDNNEISIKWNIIDVIDKAKDHNIVINKEQAKNILSNIKSLHDCSYGIIWETIDCSIDNYVNDNPGEFCTEYCPVCDIDVTLQNERKIQVCPSCNKLILPCSICSMDKNKCLKCDLENGGINDNKS